MNEHKHSYIIAMQYHWIICFLFFLIDTKIFQTVIYAFSLKKQCMSHRIITDTATESHLHRISWLNKTIIVLVLIRLLVSAFLKIKLSSVCCRPSFGAGIFVSYSVFFRSNSNTNEEATAPTASVATGKGWGIGE